MSYELLSNYFWRLLLSREIQNLYRCEPFFFSVASSTSTFFQESTLLKRWLTKTKKKQCMVPQICLAGRISPKFHQAWLSLQRRWDTYLMPMIKFKLSGENCNSGKLVSVTVNLAASKHILVWGDQPEKFKMWVT